MIRHRCFLRIPPFNYFSYQKVLSLLSLGACDLVETGGCAIGIPRYIFVHYTPKKLFPPPSGLPETGLFDKVEKSQQNPPHLNEKKSLASECVHISISRALSPGSPTLCFHFLSFSQLLFRASLLYNGP